ncbi:MAG TPA: S9 family peptidase [Gemmatimonadales bacterium]|nr:S9 family peptidase [Gemmatimonadales bacterium]
MPAMRPSLLALVVPVLLAPAGLQAQRAAGSDPIPPVAASVPHVDTVAGVAVSDPYFWLRDDKRERPEVLDYLRRENGYTEAVTRHTRALEDTLFREMVGHIKETDLSVPELVDGYYYYSRTEQGKQYPIFCRKRGSLSAREQVVLDENAVGRGHAYSRVALRQVSPDGNLLAYTHDTAGSEWYTVRVKNLRTGRLLPDAIDSVSYGLEWAGDNRTLFFTRDNAAHRPNRIFRRVLGNPAEALVVSEPDSLYSLGLDKTKDRAYLLAQSSSFTAGEVRYLPASRPTGEWRVLLPRREGVEYSAEHHGNDFLVLTNDGALNFKVLRVPATSPDSTRWTELVPADDSVLIEEMEVFEDYLVLYRRGDARQQIRVLPFGAAPYDVDFPEAVHELEPGRNPEFHSRTLRFTYSSPRTPPTVYDYDLAARTRKVRKLTEVPDFQPEQYATERVWAPAADGARVPVSLFYRMPLRKGRPRPMLLYAYGSYGASTDPGFSPRILPLVDRGYIFAIAHIRGGQEMGRRWYDQGKMLRKKNTFTDFIAAAEWLEREGYTAPDRLAIRGGSAGGLLMGAVTNMRPDLFRVVVADVPFVDVINTMRDPSLEFTTQEWQQWGNPNVPAEFAYIRSYSPYDNVGRQAYPAILATAGLNDPRVNYWEPAKWVAKLRAMKTDSNPLLLKINMGAGHGGRSGRYESLRDDAFRYAFVVDMIRTADPRSVPAHP